MNNEEILIDDCLPVYWDDKALQPVTFNLRRIDHKGKRKYATIAGNKVDKLFTSVTSFSKAVLPIGEGLLKWTKDKTPEQINDILDRSSAYGTLMDILFNYLLRDRELHSVQEVVNQFAFDKGLTIDANKWIYQLKRDILAFIQFIKDYEVKPLATSLALVLDLQEEDLGYPRLAGTLDLICEMNNKIATKTDIKKGDLPRRVIGLIDYKAKIGDMSGTTERNSFYDSECLQVILYAKMAKVHLQLEPEIVADFSPKNWRTNPDYNLKIWNGTQVYERMNQKLEHYLRIYQIDNPSDEMEIQVINDCIGLDSDENMLKMDRVELINETLDESQYIMNSILK